MSLVSRIAVFLLVIGAGTAYAGTLADVQQRGYLKCAVLASHDGFGSTDVNGDWQGFDADFCRAVGAAILGKPELVFFISTDRLSGIDSLASGSADLTARVQLGLEAIGGPGARSAGTLLHDSFGLLVRTGSQYQALPDLAGKTLCVTEAVSAHEALAQILKAQDVVAELSVDTTLSGPRKKYDAGECEALVALRSDLAGLRLRLGKPDDHRLMMLEFGKAPAGPRVRGGDDAWFKVVRWVLFALIEAEELGITQANVDEKRASAESMRVRQLLGVEGSTGKMLGLPNDWAYQVLKAVGNYAEIYERNIGPETPMRLPRTRSRLWNQGGMLFAPPSVAQ